MEDEAPNRAPPPPMEGKAPVRCHKAGRRFAVYCDPMASAIALQTENGKGLAECAGFVEGVEGAALLGVTYRTRANAAGASHG